MMGRGVEKVNKKSPTLNAGLFCYKPIGQRWKNAEEKMV